MYRRTLVTICVFTCVLLPLLLAQNSQPITGEWLIDSSRFGAAAADRVQLTLHRSDEHSNSTNSSGLLLSALHGLTRAQMESGAANVRFEIARDAGTLACEGYFRGGKGAGTFTFTPNASFVSEMRSLGYDGLSPENVFSMAVHDVSIAYIREMAALGIHATKLDQLISMRIHGVSVEYVKELKNAGFNSLTPDKLVSMRIHGVTTEFVRDLKNMGYDPSPDQLVSMRIHGVTSEFARELKSLGYASVTTDQMVSMRIHGVSGKYIQDLQARGMRNLSVDQLVSMKIHGIDE